MGNASRQRADAFEPLRAQPLTLGLLAFGDVLGHPADADDFPVRIANRRADVQHPAHGAIRPDDAVFRLKPGEPAREYGFESAVNPGLVVGMDGGHPSAGVLIKSPGGQPPDFFHGRADVKDSLRIQADEPKDLAALLGQLPEAFFALAQFFRALGDEVFQVLVQPLDAAPGETEFEQMDHLARQNGEHLALLRREMMGRAINHAQRADVQPVRGDQWRARVKADVRVAGDERVVPETFVFERVGDFKYFAPRDDVAAKGNVPRRLARFQTDFALEPLPRRINECNGGHGRAANLRGEPREVVEFRLGGCVEDVVTPQRGEAFGFVWRNGCGLHGPEILFQANLDFA